MTIHRSVKYILKITCRYRLNGNIVLSAQTFFLSDIMVIMQDTQAESLVKRIKQDMLQAFKNGERLKRDVLQTLLARISNAEAVAVPYSTEPSIGVGSTEIARKELSLDDTVKIIMDEMHEVQEAAKTLDPTSDYAKELQQKITIIQKYIS